jgi:hypothetical protein
MSLEKGMQDFFKNEYITTAIKVVLILYASQISPRAPDWMTSWLSNTYVKIALVFLIVYTIKYDFQFSLIFAIILILGMNVLSGRNMLESYKNTNYLDFAGPYNKNYKSFGNFKLLDPQNEIMPGCENMTYADLVNIFKGDHIKLQDTVQQALYILMNDGSYDKYSPEEKLRKTAILSGLPYSIEINDDTAPWVGSLLVNKNYIQFSSTCKPPGYDTTF